MHVNHATLLWCSSSLIIWQKTTKEGYPAQSHNKNWKGKRPRGRTISRSPYWIHSSRRRQHSYPKSSSNISNFNDEGRNLNFFSNKIKDCPIPKLLEKRQPMDNYNGTWDPNDHVQGIDTLLEFSYARGLVKLMLFVLTIKKISNGLV